MRDHRVGRRSWLARSLVAVGAVGAAWLAWDIATDHGPALGVDRFATIDAYVADQLADSRIPGASLAIVEDGVIVHSAGFGDDGNGNEITPDTPFWIGSNTKSITALAIQQLAENGLVDLDSPVRAYLPGFRLADPAASDAITVRNLLNQTSGISRRDGLLAVVEADPDESIQDVVDGMADLDLERRVGESFAYANLNSVVLGAVVEEVTGMTWQEYVQANVFDPLGMTNTFTDRAEAEAAGLTATHRSWFGFPIETEAPHHASLAPTGYVYAGANDMARYLAMYTNGGVLDGRRVLGRTGIDAMLTAATNERTFVLQGQTFTAAYGAGWFVGPFGVADDARWHQGSLPHFSSWIVVLPDTEQAVVILMNAGNQFEIAGANAAWSRIPQGVVDLLRESDAPTGMGSARFFIVFDTLIAMAVVAQAWTLIRIAGAASPMGRPTIGRVAPLLWEVVLAPLGLLVYPALTGGFGWGVAFSFVPDLTLAVAAVCGLAVLTGLIRAFRLVRFVGQAVDDIDLRAGPGSTSGPEALSGLRSRTSPDPTSAETADIDASPIAARQES